MARTPSQTTPNRRRRAAWGSVSKLPSGRYRAYYRMDGERIGAPDTFATKEAAQAWLATEHADHTRGVWVDPRAGTLTLAGYAWTWLDGRSDLAPRTIETYRDLLRRWVLAPLPGASGRPLDLGADPLTTVTPARVRAWHGALLKATATPRAVSTARTPHPARRWAQLHGRAVSPTGRLSPDLLASWRAAGSPVPPMPGSRRTSLDRPGRSTSAKAYALLHAIMAAAVLDGIVRDNPCRIPGAGQATPAERGTATPAEVAAITAAMPAHLSAAVTLAAWSSLRYGELFALARRHVDLDAGTLRIERAVLALTGQPITFGPPKTRKSRRTVHLPTFVTAALREHMAAHTADDPDALVFTHRDKPVTSSQLSGMMRRACAGIDRHDLTWHDLRHTGATLAYRAGASVPEVQARLGHTTMRAAMTYAHAADDSDRLIADRLHAMFAPPTA